jgi:hypothetical protein
MTPSSIQQVEDTRAHTTAQMRNTQLNAEPKYDLPTMPKRDASANSKVNPRNTSKENQQ